MQHTRIRSKYVSVFALCLLAACAAPADSVSVEDANSGPATLEGPLGEVVSDLMYGAPDERMRAAGDLASMGHEAAPATEHLVLALEDEEPAVRALAAEALGSAGGELQATAQALNERLLVDQEEGVQSAAMAALVDLGPASTPLFLRGLKHARESVRWNSARGLGLLGADAGDVLEPLVRALDDDDQHVRRSAAKALGQTSNHTPGVLQPLIRALTDEAPEVRGSAAWAIGQCGEEAKRAVLPLVDALRDESAGVRIEAARALGELGPYASHASMDLTGALDDSNPMVVDAVRAALAAIQQS